MDNLRQLWSSVRREIAKLYILVEHILPEEIVQESQEYLAHNELGLALETIAAWLIESETQVADPIKEQIVQIGLLMKYDEHDNQRLNSFKRYILTK